MKFMRLGILLFMIMMMAAAGCAGVAEFRLPSEFEGKKQIEDPPITGLPQTSSQAGA